MITSIINLIVKVLSFIMFWKSKEKPPSPEKEAMDLRKDSREKINETRRALRKGDYDKVSSDLRDLLADVDILRRTSRDSKSREDK